MSQKMGEIQKNKIKNLHKLIIKAIEDYKVFNKKLPENIVFYRMGLSEAQVNKSVEDEIIPIKEALYDKYAEKKPHIIFIIVNKKINDRFFDLNY